MDEKHIIWAKRIAFLVGVAVALLIIFFGKA